MKLPHRVRLVSQVAEGIRQEIFAGTWKERLPSSRELSAQLKVSRETIQQAIQSLSKEGLVKPSARQGVRILAKPKRGRPARTKRFGLLMAQHAAPQSFQYDTIFHELESACFQNGISLTLHRGERFFRKRSTRALEELVRQNPEHCWILRTSNAAVQQWFSQRQIPCVVWGLAREHPELPSVSVDITAATRHAAGTLLGQGHRHLALFTEKSTNTNFTSKVFAQCVESSPHPDRTVRICEHDSTLDSLSRGLNRCLEGAAPATAFFITRTYAYVALQGMLNRRGLSVPGDLSLISRDTDPLFEFMFPRPAGFTFPVKQFAMDLYSLAEKLADGVAPLICHQIILPEFQRGESIRSLPQ